MQDNSESNANMFSQEQTNLNNLNQPYQSSPVIYKNNRNDLNLALQMKLGKWDKVTDIMSKSTESKEDNSNSSTVQYDVQISKDEVAAIVEQRFDEKGRLIGRKLLNKDKQLQNGIQYIKEYISCSKDVCAYKLYALDEKGISIPHPNGNGANCYYIEEDSYGRKTKELWFDVNNNPFADFEGDYGLSYEYGDNNLVINKCLDENGEPHNNQLGYGVIHSYRDDNGNEIKKMFFTAEGEPTTHPELLGCYGQCFEYPDKNIKITGYF